MDPVGNERNGDGNHSSCGSVGQPGVGLPTGDFERWSGALELGHLSLRELCERYLEGGLFCWGPLRIGSKGSKDRQLFA